MRCPFPSPTHVPSSLVLAAGHCTLLGGRLSRCGAVAAQQPQSEPAGCGVGRPQVRRAFVLLVCQWLLCRVVSCRGVSCHVSCRGVGRSKVRRRMSSGLSRAVVVSCCFRVVGVSFRVESCRVKFYCVYQPGGVVHRPRGSCPALCSLFVVRCRVVSCISIRIFSIVCAFNCNYVQA